MAPLLDSHAAPGRSFEVAGAINTPVFELRFECAYEPPDRRACVLFHAADRVPAVLAVGDRLLLNDPLDGAADIPVPSGWYLIAGMGGDNFVFTVGGGGTPGIRFDLPAFGRAATLRRHAMRDGPGRFVVTAETPRVGRFRAWVEPSSAERYRRLSLTSAEGDRILDVDVLAIDGSPAPWRFRFPEVTGHARREPPVDASETEWRRLVERIFRAMVLRGGLNDPKIRGEIERFLKREIDWDEVRRRDAATGPAIRDAVDRRAR